MLFFHTYKKRPSYCLNRDKLCIEEGEQKMSNGNGTLNELDYYCSTLSSFQFIEAINGLHRSQRRSYQKLVEVEYDLRKNIFSTFLSTGSLVLTGIGIILALMGLSRSTFILIIALLLFAFAILGIYVSIQNLNLREEKKEEEASNAFFRLEDDSWEYEAEYHLLKNVRKRLELAKNEDLISEEFLKERMPRIRGIMKHTLGQTLATIKEILRHIEKMEKNQKKYSNILQNVDKGKYVERLKALQKDYDEIKKGVD